MTSELTIGLGLQLIRRSSNVEASLWRRLKFEDEPDCRVQLFETYVDTARKIALGAYRASPNHGLERADFQQLAIEGLLDAIDRFDPLRSVPFEAYARIRIKGRISDGLSTANERNVRFNHARQRLQSFKDAQDPSIGDDLEDISDLIINLAIGLIVEGLHSNATMDGEGVGPLGHDSIEWRELQLSLVSEIQNLPSNERTVIEQHYLNDVSFVQIARLLELSKGRVSQLHRAAIDRLRLKLGYLR